MRGLVDNGRRRLDRKAGPLLRGSSVYVFLGMVKRHPRDGLIGRNFRAFDETQCELLVVKGKGEDGAWRRPRAYHEMMDGHVAGRTTDTAGWVGGHGAARLGCRLVLQLTMASRRAICRLVRGAAGHTMEGIGSWTLSGVGGKGGCGSRG